MIPLGVLGSARVAPAASSGLTYLGGTATLTAVPLGTTGAIRHLIIVASNTWNNIGSGTLTVDGVTATKDVESPARALVSVWRVTLPTGSPSVGTVTWNYDAPNKRVAVYQASAAPTLVDTKGGSALTASLTLPAANTVAGGVAVAGFRASDTNTLTMSGLTADVSTPAIIGHGSTDGNALTVSATQDPHYSFHAAVATYSLA